MGHTLTKDDLILYENNFVESIWYFKCVVGFLKIEAVFH
jgi:hypothetical protein